MEPALGIQQELLSCKLNIFKFCHITPQLSPCATKPMRQVGFIYRKKEMQAKCLQCRILAVPPTEFRSDKENKLCHISSLPLRL